MKRIGTALTIVFIIAGFAISFFIGHYVSDKSHTESRAAQFDKYISRAIDTIEDKGLSIDGAPEMIASNIWVAHEFCDSPEISAELSNLWNTIVYEKDELLGQEDVLTAQLKKYFGKMSIVFANFLFINPLIRSTCPELLQLNTRRPHSGTPSRKSEKKVSCFFSAQNEVVKRHPIHQA